MKKYFYDGWDLEVVEVPKLREGEALLMLATENIPYDYIEKLLNEYDVLYIHSLWTSKILSKLDNVSYGRRYWESELWVRE